MTTCGRPERVRVLVISNLYPSRAHPAFGTFVEARVRAMQGLGADVRVVANHDPAVHRRIAPKYASLAWSAGREAVADRLRGRRVDVVEAHIAYPTGLIARPAAWLLGAPLVLFAHGGDVRDLPARSALHARLAGATLASAALIIANSHFLAGEIARWFPATTDRVRVLSPGIELDRFRSAPAVERTGVLFVGRLVPTKGADVLLRAIATLGGSAASLTIIGDGPERLRLQELGRELGVAIRMPGNADRDAIAAAMRRAAVVVVPSTYPEPLGLVALEAMASGAIVVASGVGGLAESITDGVNGFLVKPGDPGVLAAAIERAVRVAGDPAAGGAMREAASMVAETHDVRRSAEASLAWYGTLRA
jgi:glycosyltransferase involved in cell wall biosynthesis